MLRSSRRPRSRGQFVAGRGCLSHQTVTGHFAPTGRSAGGIARIVSIGYLRL